MKKLFLLFLFISLFSLSAFAAPYFLKEFSQEGFSDRKFSSIDVFAQNVLFNDNYYALYGNPTSYAKSVISNQWQPPVYTDLTGNNTYMLFVASDTSIVVYTGVPVIFNQTITYGEKVLRYGAFEYNNTDYLVAVTGNDGDYPYVYVHKYNTSDSSFDQMQKRRGGAATRTFEAAYGNDVSFICNERYCLVAVAIGTYQYINAGVFDLTADGNTTNIATTQMGVTTGGVHSIETSHPFDIATQDINLDGNYEYITTFTSPGAGADMYYGISYINETDGQLHIIDDNAALAHTTANGGYITQPLLGSFNTNAQVSLAVGYMSSANKMILTDYYYASGVFSKYSEHTSLFSPVVSIMSNMFVCKIFTNDAEANFCAVGYTPGNATVLMAATDFGTGFLETNTVLSIGSNATNYFTPDISTAQGLAYGINANNFISSGYYITDILTPFGIFKTTAPNYFTGLDTLETSYNIPLPIVDTAVSPARLKNSPYYDLVSTTATNMIYFSDGFNILPADIDAYTVNPCISAVWSTNTSVEATVTPRSFNDYYQVRARAILYYGDTNAQDSGFSGFAASGTVFIFNFQSNKSIQNGILRFEVEDDQSSGITALNIPFSASSVGVSLGDCQTSLNGLLAAQAAAAAENTSLIPNETYTVKNNVLKAAIVEESNAMGVPSIIFILIILIGVNITIFLMSMTSPQLQNNLGAVLVGILLFDIMFFIIFSLMGLISVAFTITIIMILIVIAIMYIASIWNKANGG